MRILYRMITTLIFDLEGLLADTERLHMQSYREVMARNGFDLTENQYRDHWIRDGLGIRQYREMHQLDIDAAAFHEEKTILYRHLVKTRGKPMPGAIEAVKRLADDFNISLASNSYRKNVLLVLEVIDMNDLFEIVVTGDDVSQAKPAPEIFEITARKMQAAPNACLVIEDSVKGILAADAAGMKSIAVPNEYTADNNFSAPSAVVDSLNEITTEMIKKL
ncbi:MAG: HAD family phosphatase [bacterium]|nr:HAD family phosphatase [bacterium]